LTDVTEFHAAVEHTAVSTAADAVKSAEPKLKPDTVRDDDPVSGALSCMYEATGPSNEKILIWVPASADTLTWVAAIMRLI
jgi:hypothetical protein